MMGLAHSLTEARHEEVVALQHATEQSGFVAAIGEADTGKTVLLNRLWAELEKQEMWVVKIDLDRAYAVRELTWLWLRALARAISGRVPFSHLTALDSSMWPGTARRAVLSIAETLDVELSEIALADGPPPPRGKVDDWDLLRRAIEATGDAAVGGHPVLLLVDHLEAPALTPRHPVDVRRLLWMVRSVSQGNPQLRVVVAGRPGTEDEFADADAAFYQDGRVMRIGRPSAGVWEQAAAARGPTADLRRLLSLTGGHVPSTLQLADAVWGDPGANPSPEATFVQLAARQQAHTTRCVQHARTLNRLGGRMLEAISRGEPPYGATPHGHPKEVQRALFRLRLAGLIHQDEPRKWRLTDPLVAHQLRHGSSSEAWEARLLATAEGVIPPAG